MTATARHGNKEYTGRPIGRYSPLISFVALSNILSPGGRSVKCCLPHIVLGVHIDLGLQQPARDPEVVLAGSVVQRRLSRLGGRVYSGLKCVGKKGCSGQMWARWERARTRGRVSFRIHASSAYVGIDKRRGERQATASGSETVQRHTLCFSSSFTISSCPAEAAMCSGVHPLCIAGRTKKQKTGVRNKAGSGLSLGCSGMVDVHPL